MHVQDLVGISGITRVLLVCSCQQGAHPRSRPIPLAPTMTIKLYNLLCLTLLLRKNPFFLVVYVKATTAVSYSVHYYSNDSQNFNITSLSSQKHFVLLVYSMNVSPCHHGMARPQVADGGTASYMEGSCE
jgi:hypothetical protein